MKNLSLVLIGASLIMPGPAHAAAVSPVSVVQSSAPARAAASSSPALPARAVTSAAASNDPQKANTDYILEIDDVEGESTEAAGIEPDEIDVRAAASSAAARMEDKDVQRKEGEPVRGIEPDEIDVADEPQEASTDAFLKIKDIPSASTETPGVEPDEIDVAADPEPLTPDFGILLGEGGSDDEEEELTEEQRIAAAQVLLEGMQEQGAPAETISLNVEKIETTARQQVRLFGFIPMTVNATVEINAEGKTSVSYPWWAFLAGGKDGDALGAEVLSALTTVMKAKHDTLMNAIGNVR